MNKRLLAALCFSVLIFYLTACTGTPKATVESGITPMPTKSLSTTVTTIIPTETITDTTTPAVTTIAPTAPADITAPSGTLLYENTRLGFSLEFPKSWYGYYNVVEDNGGGIEVYFIGKSRSSESYEGLGLCMFLISAEAEVDPFYNVINIGTAHGVNFCYYTPTDYPLSELLTPPIQSPESSEESDLRTADWHKGQEMEKDFEGILKTFKEISYQDTTDAAEKWKGKYLFSEKVSDKKSLDYSIDILKVNSDYFAYIQIDPFPFGARRMATLIIDNNSVKIVFDRYLLDDTHGEPYKKGDVLLTLTKEGSDIYTSWGAIQPVLKENAAAGKICFKRVD